MAEGTLRGEGAVGMKSSKRSNGDDSIESLEKTLLQRIKHFSLDHEIREIAGQIREQAIAELNELGDKCEEKQQITKSIKIIPGQNQDEYLIVSEGNYGRNLEYGTRNSLESPWFTPAFVTVAGSIGNCLHGALKRALLKARRLPARR